MLRRATIMAVFASLALAAPAEGKLRWRGCPEAEGVRCAKLRVPLDRSGALTGSVPLHVARVSFSRHRDRHLMYLSGGPGGAGVIEMIDVLLELPRLMRDYTVIGFDQRGTGRSGLLRCPALERDARLRSTRAGEDCARRLGPERAFYTTPDSVEDMEAIRRAVGAEKLTLFGISYGTELALEYARAYPARVERMILDSTVDPDDSEPFGLAGFRAMVPSLRALCPDGCRGVSADPAADLAALTAKLRAAPLRGVRYDDRGRRRARDAAADRDRRPDVRRRLQPGAPRGRADGRARRARPRRRRPAAAAARGVGAVRGCRSAPREFSAARYATVCEETPLPWPRGTPLADRFGVARERALALPPDGVPPVRRGGRLRGRDRPLPALAGPGAAAARRPAAPYPAVPTLLLQGEEDLRTPPEVSAHVATLIPGAQRVTVPGVGHAIVGGDTSGCGQRQLLRFVAGKPVRTRCPRVSDRRAGDGRAADRARAARARRGAGGTRRADGERGRRDARLPRLRALARARPRRRRRRAARRDATGTAAGCRCAGSSSCRA